ncbi:beta family protein [Brevibacillus borstelensis]|uniref:beta family protein n=1 Tax=Brevibacillus borstelensis TaxID=45462 RepID=UPI0030C4573C
MFDHSHYVPVIKWKRGEQRALEYLDHPLKNHMTPLLEITPIFFEEEEDEKSRSQKLDKELVNIGQDVRRCWNNDTPVFVDTIQLEVDDQLFMSTGKHFLEYVIEDIEAHGTPAIPVVNTAHYQPFWSSLENVLRQYGRGLCLRVKRGQLNNLGNLKNDIDLVINNLHLTPENIDLVLDFEYIGDDTPSVLFTNALMGIVQFPYLTQWRSFSLMGTSMPSSLRMKANTLGNLPRNEFDVYKQLVSIRGGLGRLPSFGDYTINNNTYTNFDPSMMQVAATIRYTTADKFLIFRGASTKGTANGGFQQYISLAQDVVKHPDYYGRSYSYGDGYIYDCAHQLNGVSTGSHETWRRAGVNHHLTLVINELANLHGSSTPGTPVASIRP